MGIQSSTNKVLKDLGVLAQEREQENLQLDKEVTAYKKDVLKYRRSALELQNAKLAEKKAAFEKSLERRKHALERVQNARKILEQKNTEIEKLLAEAKAKREARAKLDAKE
ncbi:MAG: hypothetical protein J6T10_11185 [Methanobrevibacter sp.]|nr:hypothetical protein [Methanobrevibacter sp.]